MPSGLGENDRNSMPVYESHPPAWLPKTHASADLGMYTYTIHYEKLIFLRRIGYSGFHPPRPGQDEDVMSPANVKNGFIIGDPVPVSEVVVKGVPVLIVLQGGDI